MSLYSLDSEDTKSVEDIFNNLPKLKVVEEYRKKLSEMTDEACNSLTQYLNDEYIIRFEEIVISKARKIVEALLRGEDLDCFGLKARKLFSTDEMTAYDSAKVREAIVRDFKDEIANAEMIELKKRTFG